MMSDQRGTPHGRRIPLLWALAAVLALVGCDQNDENDDAPAEPTGTAEPDAEAEPGDERDEPGGGNVFTIAGTGDVLIHDNVIDEAAELSDGDGYDFRPLMDGVSELIEGADLALCGLEVPIAPEGVEPVGYPVFAAPPELADDLASAGFHGCSTANNHSFDQGEIGRAHV